MEPTKATCLRQPGVMRPVPDHRVQMLMSGMPVLIQGDSGGDISVLWGDTFGPCEKKK